MGHKHKGGKVTREIHVKLNSFCTEKAGRGRNRDKLKCSLPKRVSLVFFNKMKPSSVQVF